MTFILLLFVSIWVQMSGASFDLRFKDGLLSELLQLLRDHAVIFPLRLPLLNGPLPLVNLHLRVFKILA